MHAFQYSAEIRRVMYFCQHKILPEPKAQFIHSIIIYLSTTTGPCGLVFRCVSALQRFQRELRDKMCQNVDNITIFLQKGVFRITGTPTQFICGEASSGENDNTNTSGENNNIDLAQREKERKVGILQLVYLNLDRLMDARSLASQTVCV